MSELNYYPSADLSYRHTERHLALKCDLSNGLIYRAEKIYGLCNMFFRQLVNLANSHVALFVRFSFWVTDIKYIVYQ